MGGKKNILADITTLIKKVKIKIFVSKTDMFAQKYEHLDNIFRLIYAFSYSGFEMIQFSRGISILLLRFEESSYCL